MSLNDLLKTANRIAKKLARSETAIIFSDFEKELRSVLSEMLGDYETLKQKRFDPHLLKKFGDLHRDLMNMINVVSYEKPRDIMKSIVDYILHTNAKSLIAMLYVDIQRHLKKTEVQFDKSLPFSQARCEGLQHLMQLLYRTNAYLIKHPESIRGIEQEHDYDPNGPAYDKTMMVSPLRSAKTKS